MSPEQLQARWAGAGDVDAHGAVTQVPQGRVRELPAVLSLPSSTGSSGLDASSHSLWAAVPRAARVSVSGALTGLTSACGAPSRVWSTGVERGMRPRPTPAVGPALWPLGGAAVLRVCRDGPGPRAEAGWGRSFPQQEDSPARPWLTLGV